jgi:hypothetical protein
MAKLTWRIETGTGGGAVDITDKVLSMNFSFGREKYLDTYSGKFLNLTINNAADYASTIAYGTEINCEIVDNISNFKYRFWVQEINFNDAPGDLGLNTATLICADWLSRAGRVQAKSYVIPQDKVNEQCLDLNASAGGPLPTDLIFGGIGDSSTSIGSAITYTGTVANYVNLAVTTERGYLFIFDSQLGIRGRNEDIFNTPLSIELGRTATATQIGYQSFDRIQNGLQFINNATISSTGVADQTVSNASSVSTYGNSFYSSQTVDYNATQANGNASWIANTFSEPASLRFSCSFTDRAQNQTALDDFFANFNGPSRIVTLNYTPPGGVSTAVDVVVEGYSFNVTPQQTTVTFDMSPLQYYQFFTLDSTLLGILDTSRLGW